MNYQLIYNNLMLKGSTRFNGVNKLKARKAIGYYVERHRKIPGCMGGEYIADNIAWLTPEEHFVAHQLLIKMHPNNQKIIFAAKMMTIENKLQCRSRNKLYGWLKRRCDENSKEFISEEGRKIISDMMKERNPNKNCKPWNHVRATEASKDIWKQSNVLYGIWIENGFPSYSKLATIHRGECYTHGNYRIGPYMNMVKYFRKGWKPYEDKEWLEFIKQSEHKV